jgi:hypothetical protein
MDGLPVSGLVDVDGWLVLVAGHVGRQTDLAAPGIPAFGAAREEDVVAVGEDRISCDLVAGLVGDPDKAAVCSDVRVTVVDVVAIRHVDRRLEVPPVVDAAGVEDIVPVAGLRGPDTTGVRVESQAADCSGDLHQVRRVGDNRAHRRLRSASHRRRIAGHVVLGDASFLTHHRAGVPTLHV